MGVFSTTFCFFFLTLFGDVVQPVYNIKIYIVIVEAWQQFSKTYMQI